jgi:lipopolysaccharide exporter
MTIERRMARSAAWMIGLRLADRTIGLVSVLFLARLLVPADFGLVAMGTVILGALEAMSAFGFEMALIKRQAKDRARWDSAWTLNVMIGAFNATVIAALAPLAALFYGEPRVTSVMLVLAASALVSGLRNIGMVEFEQELRFGRIVMLSLTRRTVSFVVTLTLAWWYGSYWALLVGMVTGHVVDLLLSYAFSPYRPRFSLVAWRDLFSFSKWLLLNNVLFYTSQRGGDAVVGNQAGASALGTYTVSLELANLPTSELVWPVMRAVFPGYAMMSSNVQRLAQGFLKVFALVLMFALPAAAGIALLAEPLVAVLLGPRWSDATPIIQVLAIAGGIRAAQANTGSVYLALDRPQLASAIMFLGILLSLGPFAIRGGTHAAGGSGVVLRLQRHRHRTGQPDPPHAPARVEMENDPRRPRASGYRHRSNGGSAAAGTTAPVERGPAVAGSGAGAGRPRADRRRDVSRDRPAGVARARAAAGVTGTGDSRDDRTYVPAAQRRLTPKSAQALLTASRSGEGIKAGRQLPHPTHRNGTRCPPHQSDAAGFRSRVAYRRALPPAARPRRRHAVGTSPYATGTARHGAGPQPRTAEAAVSPHRRAGCDGRLLHLVPAPLVLADPAGPHRPALQPARPR